MFKKVLIIIAIICIILFFILIGINLYVIFSSSSKIITVDELKDKEDDEKELIFIIKIFLKK